MIRSLGEFVSEGIVHFTFSLGDNWLHCTVNVMHTTLTPLIIPSSYLYPVSGRNAVHEVFYLASKYWRYLPIGLLFGDSHIRVL